MSEQFWNLISCPICSKTGCLKNYDNLICQSCDNKFFSLRNIPCIFPAGTNQKGYWDHLLGVLVEDAKKSVSILNLELRKPGLSALTRRRLENNLEFNDLISTSVVEFLKYSGLQANKNALYDAHSTNSFWNYYELILRDWCWGWPPGANDEEKNEKITSLRVPQKMKIVLR